MLFLLPSCPKFALVWRGGRPRRSYLNHAAVHRAGGADHMDIRSGSGAMPLQALTIAMEAGEREGIWAKGRLVV